MWANIGKRRVRLADNINLTLNPSHPRPLGRGTSNALALLLLLSS